MCSAAGANRTKAPTLFYPNEEKGAWRSDRHLSIFHARQPENKETNRDDKDVVLITID